MQTELRADVDQLEAGLEQFGHHLSDLGRLLRQDHRFGAARANRLWRVRGHDQVGFSSKTRHGVSDSLTMQAIATGVNHGKMRVIQQNAQGDLACIASNTKNCDGDCHEGIPEGADSISRLVRGKVLGQWTPVDASGRANALWSVIEERCRGMTKTTGGFIQIRIRPRLIIDVSSSMSDDA